MLHPKIRVAVIGEAFEVMVRETLDQLDIAVEDFLEKGTENNHPSFDRNLTGDDSTPVSLNVGERIEVF